MVQQIMELILYIAAQKLMGTGLCTILKLKMNIKVKM